jgi:hypothetical protein
MPSRLQLLLPLLLISLLLATTLLTFCSAAESADLSSALGSTANRPSSKRNLGYIVVLKDAPVLTYSGGGDADMAETASIRAPGGKLDVSSAAVAAYAEFVETQSVAVAARAGVAAEQLSYKFRCVMECLQLIRSAADQRPIPISATLSCDQPKCRIRSQVTAGVRVIMRLELADS